MGAIQSVLGPIDSADLGFTLMHEHVLVASWEMRQAFSDWINVGDLIDQAVAELSSARELGVQTIVDVTPVNAGRDIHILREVAARSGVPIVAATGFFWYDDPWLAGWEVDHLVDLLLRDIEVGIQGTDSKAGIIKAATDAPGVTATNRKSLQVAARLHMATGLPITTHTSVAHRNALPQMDIFEAEGIDLARVVVGHCGDTDDMQYLEAILRRGSFIGMDRFGNELALPTERRIATVAELCRRGWAERLTLSHDHVCRLDWYPEAVRREWVPLSSFCHLPADIVPALRQAGVTAAEIHTMTVDNPARILGGSFRSA